MFDFVYKGQHKKPGSEDSKAYAQLECLECLKLTNKMLEAELISSVDYGT